MCTRKGVNSVMHAVSAIPRPKMVAPPKRDAIFPPRGQKQYPYENTLKIKPFTFESQLKSATYRR